ncbi:MAG: prepilin-type N-terminal cleavage/methylation domain-containing protein [Gammaproteobacteria bacterium]|nr:prepilin-type N-terminal cleavage/methylation domain-containing protein [Gammaproteobacteria bacterium]
MDVLKYRNAGFSLVELVIIISIISILATVALMKLPSAPAVNAYGQAEQLATDIRYTQALSINTNQRHYLQISGSTYQVINAVTSTPIMLSKGSTTVTLGSGISFGALTALPSSLIQFDNFGTPYTTSTPTSGTPLTTQASIPVKGASSTATVTIQPETGTVAIQ